MFLRSQHDNSRETVTPATDLVLHENVKKNIECEFAVTNVMVSMDMYLGSVSSPYALNVSDDFYYLMNSTQKSSSVGLATQSYSYHFKNRHRYPKVKYHRQRFTCHTRIKQWKTYDLFVNILVKGTQLYE